MRAEHEELCLEDRLVGEGQMDSHLVAIEVGVEAGTGQRMELYSLTLDHLRLERQDTMTVQCRSTVEEHRMSLHYVFENLVDLRITTVNDFLGRLNGLYLSALEELTDDKRLVELSRHLFRQTALVHLKLRTYDDNGTGGIVHTFTEEVLTETTLLTLEGVAEGLERAVGLGLHGRGLTAVIEEGVDSLLQHTLLITEDDIRRFDLDEPFESVITDDDTTIEVVEVGGGKTSTVQGYQRTELRRGDRQSLQDHPLGAVLTIRCAESLDYLETLEGLLTALRRSRFIGGVTQLVGESVEVEVAEQVVNGLSTHLDDDLVRIGILEGVVILRHDGEYLLVLVLIEEHFVLDRNSILIRFALLADLLTLEDAGTYDEVFLVVDDRLQFLGRDTEQRSHLGRQGAEIPDMGNGNDELDMTHTLTTHFLLGYLHTASFADDTFVTDAFVFTTVALVVFGRTEDTLTEQTVTFRFVGTIVNRFRLEHLARGDLHDLIGRSETDSDLSETGFLCIILFKSHISPPKLFHFNTKCKTL